jgi:N-acetyl-gamma-glutamyl-phosphate reductase
MRAWSPTPAVTRRRCNWASCHWSKPAWSTSTGLIADAKSGVSGAGRKAEVSRPVLGSLRQFQGLWVPGHRHLPEIRRVCREWPDGPVGLTFVPHLTPMIRGIHATLYARIKREADFQALFEQRIPGREPFVDVLPPGSHPDTRSVRAANVCRIAVHRPQGRGPLVVLSVIDNLVKGAAGQAVQNMNIMFGLPESEGLWQLRGAPLTLKGHRSCSGDAPERWRQGTAGCHRCYHHALVTG